MNLITATEVINLVLPAKNLDTNLLEDSIGLAELKYLKKVLGAGLYQALLSENQSQAFTGLHGTLLNNYLKPALARFVVYEALPLMKAEITSNGIQTPEVDYAAPASDGAFAMLRNKMLSDGGLLLQEMQQYMADNAAQFSATGCSKDSISENNLPYLY